MTSILKVTEIQDPTNSNTAITIDSSGHVEIAKRSLSANFTSGSTIIQPTANGIPSWAEEIKISFYGVSQAGSSNVLFRAYVGGSVVTTNYEYTSIYFLSGDTISDRSAGSDGGFAFYGWTNASNDFNGTVTFTKVTDDYKYVAFGQYYNDGYANYGGLMFNGRVDLAGPISGVDLYTSTNFDAGQVRVTWR